MNKPTFSQQEIDTMLAEGWTISECKGSKGADFQLQKNDDLNTFSSDLEAFEFVLKKSLDDSGLHAKAMQFLATNHPDEYFGQLTQLLVEKKEVSFLYKDRLYLIGDSLSEEGYSVDVFYKGAVIDEDFPFDGGVCTGSAEDAIYFMLPDSVSRPEQENLLNFTGAVQLESGEIRTVKMAIGIWDGKARPDDDDIFYWFDESREHIARVLSCRFKGPDFELFTLESDQRKLIQEHFEFPSFDFHEVVLAFDKLTKNVLLYSGDVWKFKTGLVNLDGAIEGEKWFDEFEEAFQDFEGRTKEELVQFDDELKLAQSLLDGAFLKCPSTPIVLRYSNGAFEDEDGHIHRLIDFVNVPLIEQSSESD